MSRDFFCNILLPRPISFTAGEIGIAVRKLAPQGADLLLECPSGLDKPGPTLITLDGVTIAILNMPFPVPAGEFDGTLSNNFIWPDGRKAAASHTAHVIVQTMSLIGDRALALKAARALTLVAAALAGIGKALAVYWLPADNFWRADLVPAAATSMMKGARLPTELWVRVYLDHKKDPAGLLTSAVASRGLAAFIGRELETDYSSFTPQALITLVLGTSHMLIDADLAFHDDETIGEVNSGQNFRIKLKDQGSLGLGPIYALSAPR